MRGQKLAPLNFSKITISDPSMRSVEIDRQPVELYKILKFEGLAASGAEAKQIIADGLVSVNGEIELRKRRKMLDGDVVRLFDVEFKLSFDPNLGQTRP